MSCLLEGLGVDPPQNLGPIGGVATFGDFDEAIELANGHGYGLSSAIYTNDPRSAFRFRSAVSAGMVSPGNASPPVMMPASAALENPAKAVARTNRPPAHLLREYICFLPLDIDPLHRPPKSQPATDFTVTPSAA